MIISKIRIVCFCSLAFALVGSFQAEPALAQDLMMSGLDLNSPRYTTAEMTRTQIEEQLAAGKKPDLSDKSLNGLDLSGLDLSGINFRAARLNKANLKGTKLVGAILDQVWALKADFSNADLSHASLFASQMQDANFDGADLSYTRITGDFTRAHMRKAKFHKANLAADMTNQSMGLIHAVLRSTDLTGADFTDADLSRADLEFANLNGANLVGAILTEADASGATLQKIIFGQTNLKDCDVTSATIDAAQAHFFAAASNFDRAFRK